MIQRYRIIMLLLLATIFHSNGLTAMQNHRFVQAAINQVGRRIMEGEQAPIQMHPEMVNVQQRIERLRTQGVPENDPRMQDLRRELGRWDQVFNLGMGAANLVLEEVRELGREEREAQAHQRNTDRAVKTALATEVGREGARVRRAEINNRGQLERLQAGLQWADEHKWKIILAGLGAVGGYYAIKLAYQYIQARMGKPTLVRQTTRHGVSESVYNFFSNLFNDEPERPTRLDDIVLTPDIESKINILADDAKQANALNLPYQNLLFYGPPGTGKTEFARRLAVYSDMDVAILSGADVAQFPNGEGITEIHKLFAWAEASQRGLLIFIDEAEACFRDRATLDTEGINIVNAFLSHTGSNSTKFMLVLATNYEDELDKAVLSRVHRKIPFDLPGKAERFKIFKKKMALYLFNDHRTITRDGQEVEVYLTVDSAINDEFLTKIAEATTGFSGRSIDQAVTEMRMRAYRSGNNVVTTQIFDTVVKDKALEVEKERQTAAYQRQRQQQKLHGSTPESTAPVIHDTVQPRAIAAR